MVNNIRATSNDTRRVRRDADGTFYVPPKIFPIFLNLIFQVRGFMLGKPSFDTGIVDKAVAKVARLPVFLDVVPVFDVEEF